MKYIVTVNEEDEEEIFIFPDSVNHDVMAEAVCHLKNSNKFTFRRIRRNCISAGFFDGSCCYGRSESLCMESREEEDFKLIYKDE